MAAQGPDPVFSFWRDSNGNEVDLLVDRAGTLTPIEIKAGMTLNRDYFTGLQRWTTLGGNVAGEPALVFGAMEAQQRSGMRALGWQQVNQVV